jgi:hypothetical protein
MLKVIQHFKKAYKNYIFKTWDFTLHRLRYLHVKFHKNPLENIQDIIVYFFLVGACVRIYKILQRNATFLLVTLFFYLHYREMCNIAVFCTVTVNQAQAAIFVSSCLSFPFVFCVVFVYLLKKQFLVVKKFLYVNKMS